MSLGFPSARNEQFSSVSAKNINGGIVNANVSRVSVRAYIPVINVDPLDLDALRNPVIEGEGSILLNVRDSRLYIVSNVGGNLRWLSANAQDRYDALKARYLAAKLRRSIAMRGATRSNPVVDDLLTTSWVEGIVDFTVTDNEPTVDIVVRWRRQYNGIEFDHELAQLDGIVPNASVFITGSSIAFLPFRMSPMSPFRAQIDGTGLITNWFTGPWDPYLTWNNLADEFQNSTTIDTSAAVRDPRFAAFIQGNSESDSLFLTRLFGTSLSFILDVRKTQNVDVGNISVAGAVNLFPKVDEGTPEGLPLQTPTPPANTLFLDSGRIYFTPDVDPTPSDLPATVATDAYNLWRDPDTTLADRALIQLPSTVLHTGNIVSTEIFNNIPHASIPVNLRTFVRAPSSDVPFMNYCRIRSVSAELGIHRASLAPNTAVWYFWNRGHSLWVFGTDSGNIENFYFQDVGGDRTLDTRSVANILALYQFNAPFGGVNFDDTFTNPRLSTQIIGPFVLRDGVPDRTNVLQSSMVCAFWGASIGDEDIIRFNSLGLGTGGDDPLFKDNGGQPVAPIEDDGMGGFFQAPGAEERLATPDFPIPSITFTRTMGDTGTYLASVPRVFPYGTFTFNPVDISTRLQILFPPTWYLTVSQGVTPQILDLESRINALQADLDFYVTPILGAVIDSIDRIGLTSEIISARIFRLEQGVRVRIDELAESITLVAGALNNFISAQNASFTDMFEGVGGNNAGADILNFLVTNGPTILTIVGTITGFSGASVAARAITAGIEYGQSKYREQLIQNTVTSFISRAIALANSGDEAGAISAGMIGITGFGELVRVTTIDTITGTVTVDTNMLALGRDITGMLSPSVQNMVQEMDAGNENLMLTIGTTENIMLLTENVDGLLIELNTLGAQLGLAPIDPNDPMLC